MRGLTKLIENKSEKQKLPTETISSKTPEEITAKQEEINLQCKARGNNVAKRKIHFELETIVLLNS